MQRPHSLWCAAGSFLLKSGFLIESRKSRGDVAGPSPIWLKLGVVRRLDPKPPKMTLFYVVRTVGGDLEGLLAQRGEKMQFPFSTIAPFRWLL